MVSMKEKVQRVLWFYERRSTNTVERNLKKEYWQISLGVEYIKHRCNKLKDSGSVGDSKKRADQAQMMKLSTLCTPLSEMY